MKIKICGLNPNRDVQLCIDLKINYLGFVFYEKSPRNVNLQDIRALSKYDRKDSAFVAVTVNPKNEFIHVYWYGLIVTFSTINKIIIKIPDK